MRTTYQTNSPAMTSFPTTKVRHPDHIRTPLCVVALAAGMLAFAGAQASRFDGPPPNYSISPSTNGLNVSYFAQQDKVKITLYMVNHERFPITCQASYDSGPEKKRAYEQTFNPEKAIAFPFDYGRSSGTIVLSFTCEKTPVEPARH